MLRGTLRRAVACMLLPLTLLACTKWYREPVSPEVFAQHDEVRLVRTDESRLVVREAVIEGDRVIGFGPTISTDPMLRRSVPVAVALADVTAVEYRTTRVTWVAAAVFVVLAAGVGLIGEYSY